MTAHLIVRVAWTHWAGDDYHTEERTVPIDVTPEPGETPDDLVYRHEADITAKVPPHWGDWDLVSAELVGAEVAG